jgi:hypothetical protein
MRSASTAALVLTLVLARAVSGASIVEYAPPYKPVDIVMLLQDEKAMKALNIVSYQEAGIKAIVASWPLTQHQDTVAIVNLKGPDKDGRARAVFARRADALFQSLSRVLSPEQLKRMKQILLQQWGITVLEHAEIRGALKLSAEQAERLTTIHVEHRNEILKLTMEGKIPRNEGYNEYNRMMRIISDRVRSALSAEQQQILDDLIGAPYAFF